MLAVPLAFELPIIMWILARWKVLSYKRVNKIRKVVPVGLAIFTAIITPTVDYVNFFIMYIPMLLLFESGMFLMWTVTPEQGNYLWLRSVSNTVSRIRRVIRAIVYSPVTVPRWLYRKVRR